LDFFFFDVDLLSPAPFFSASARFSFADISETFFLGLPPTVAAAAAASAW
jgi:hypothetical protein